MADMARWTDPATADDPALYLELSHVFSREGKLVASVEFLVTGKHVACIAVFPAHEHSATMQGLESAKGTY